MADDFGWVGGLMGTMIVGGVLMNMTNNMFGGQQRQQQRPRRQSKYSYSRVGKSKKFTRKLNHPGNFDNVLPRW